VKSKVKKLVYTSSARFVHLHNLAISPINLLMLFFKYPLVLCFMVKTSKEAMRLSRIARNIWTDTPTQRSWVSERCWKPTGKEVFSLSHSDPLVYLVLAIVRYNTLYSTPPPSPPSSPPSLLTHNKTGMAGFHRGSRERQFKIPVRGWLK